MILLHVIDEVGQGDIAWNDQAELSLDKTISEIRDDFNGNYTNQRLLSLRNQVWQTCHWNTSAFALHLGSKQSTWLWKTIHSKPRFKKKTLKLALVRDVIPMHTITSFQWLRPMFAWSHCRCESNQGCTSHTRISQSNLFSSFLLCASFTHPCTLTASMHVHTLAS